MYFVDTTYKGFKIHIQLLTYIKHSTPSPPRNIFIEVRCNQKVMPP